MGKGRVYRRLSEEYPGLDLAIESCIRQCSLCREMPVAEVDGKRVVAGDVDKLYRRIVELVEQEAMAGQQ